jgi:hypothetical protein
VDTQTFVVHSPGTAVETLISVEKFTHDFLRSGYDRRREIKAIKTLAESQRDHSLFKATSLD